MSRVGVQVSGKEPRPFFLPIPFLISGAISSSPSLQGTDSQPPRLPTEPDCPQSPPLAAKEEPEVSWEHSEDVKTMHLHIPQLLLTQ